MKVRRIGIVGYDGLQALDVSGPADVFTTANSLAGLKTAPYDVVLVGTHKGPLQSESGIALHATESLSPGQLFDTIIVPGGEALRTQSRTRAAVAAWLRTQSRSARRVASVCTGIYALAESGLLDGRTATTHWRYAADVQQRWKKIQIDADAIYTRDGKYYTSAGITAGIDLSLAFVEEDLGNELALQVARELVVYLKRSGGQLQYSQPLANQVRAKSRFGDIAAWIRGNLHDDLTIEALAERAQLSPRHFNRKFRAEFGVTPADFVEEVRLDEARWLLVNGGDSIEEVARGVGYRSDDTFRRAFERRFRVSPGEYRKRFGGLAA